MSADILLNLNKSIPKEGTGSSQTKNGEQKTAPSLFDSILSEVKNNASSQEKPDNSLERKQEETRSKTTPKTVDQKTETSKETGPDPKSEKAVPKIFDSKLESTKNRSGDNSESNDSLEKVSKKLVDMVTKKAKEELGNKVKEAETSEKQPNTKEVKSETAEDDISPEEVKSRTKEIKGESDSNLKAQTSDTKDVSLETGEEEISPEEVKSRIKEIKSELDSNLKAQTSDTKDVSLETGEEEISPEEVKRGTKDVKSEANRALKADLKDLKSTAKEAQTSLKTELKDNSKEIKTDISDLKTQITVEEGSGKEIRSEIKELKADLKNLKSDAKEAQTSVKTELKDNTKEIKSDIKEIQTQVTGKVVSGEEIVSQAKELKADSKAIDTTLKDSQSSIKDERLVQSKENASPAKEEAAPIRTEVDPETFILNDDRLVEGSSTEKSHEEPANRKNKTESKKDDLSVSSNLKDLSSEAKTKQDLKDPLLASMFLSSQRKLKEVTSQEQLNSAQKNIEENKTMESVSKSASMLELNAEDMEVEVDKGGEEAGQLKKNPLTEEKNSQSKTVITSNNRVLDRMFLEKQLSEKVLAQGNILKEGIAQQKGAAEAVSGVNTTEVEAGVKETVVTLQVPSSIVETIQNKIIGAQQKMGSFMSEVARNMYQNYKPPVTSFRVNLNPANLGSIAIVMKANKSDNSLSVSMNMSNASTMDVFADNKTVLQNALSRNLNDGSNISLNFAMQSQSDGSENPFNQQSSGGQNNNQNNQNSANNRIIEEEVSEEVLEDRTYM